MASVPHVVKHHFVVEDTNMTQLVYTEGQDYVEIGDVSDGFTIVDLDKLLAVAMELMAMEQKRKGQELMTDSFSALMRYMASVHTVDDDNQEVSVMVGGYVIVSTEETTTIKSQENPDGVVFPRHAVELLVEMLQSHIPSDEESDDFEEHEAEA